MSKLTYIRLPKTASTSMTKWLSKNKFDYNILGFRGMREKIEEINDTDYHFAITRNPFDRAVSSWAYLENVKIYRAKRNKQLIGRRFRNYLDSKPISFLDFLKKDFSEMNPFELIHSKPQYDILKDENNSINYINHIGNFDDIKKTLQKICEVSNKNFKECFAFPKSKPSNHNEYKTYYSDEEVNLVVEKYSDDFKFLNFSKSLFLTNFRAGANIDLL